MGNEPQGLGGWLILVGISVVLAPLRIGLLVVGTYVPVFTEGAWDALTSPESEDYDPMWGPFLIGEIGINVLLIVSWLVVAVFYFTKHRLFPYLFSGIMLFSLVFIVGDALAYKLIEPDEPVFDPQTTRTLVQQLIGTCIWVPYMFMSRRVKNTFVN